MADTGHFLAFNFGEDALRIADNATPFSCGYAHLGLGVVALRQGNLRRALRSFERALAAGAFADSPVGFAYVALHFGYALALAGRANEGIPILEQSIEVAESKVLSPAIPYVWLMSVRLTFRWAGGRGAKGGRVHLNRPANSGAGGPTYSLRMLGEVDLYREPK